MNSNMLYNRQKEIGDEAFITIKTDLKGHITYANSYFLNIVNAKNSDLIGKNHNIVCHPDIESTVTMLSQDADELNCSTDLINKVVQFLKILTISYQRKIRIVI